MIPGGVNPMLLSAGGSGYQVQRSLRLRASINAMLYKDYPAGSGSADTNALKKTISFLCKRGGLGAYQNIYTNSIDASNRWQISFTTDGSLNVFGREGGVTVCDVTTAAKFRDPTALLHIVISTDSAQATASDRISIEVNGQAMTLSGTLPTLNSQTAALFLRPAAGTWSSRIGMEAVNGSGVNQFDGYLADFIVVDGQRLTSSAFGGLSALGLWGPKEYQGTYGANGFRLKFDDPTSLVNLLADSSGNGNNWSTSTVSLTAGVTYDSMLDVPLGGGGNERGNYCTLNPANANAYSASATISAGNLTTSQSNTYVLSVGTIAVSSGKWYWEASGFTGSYPNVGVTNAATATQSFDTANTWQYVGFNGNKINANTGVAYGAPFTGGDVIGVALDMDTGTLTFYKNSVSQGVAYNTGLSGLSLVPSFASGFGSSGGTFNFGQRPFAYPPPSGFKALHTGNLTSDTVTVSGSFTGNASADGPFVWMNGAPETLTINGNAVPWGTHADKTAGGFKLRTSSASYNSTGTNNWTATVLTPASKSAFRKQLAKTN